MQAGVEFGQGEPGELIFPNLPNDLDSGEDTTAPSAPTPSPRGFASNLGIQGVGNSKEQPAPGILKSVAKHIPWVTRGLEHWRLGDLSRVQKKRIENFP